MATLVTLEPEPQPHMTTLSSSTLTEFQASVELPVGTRVLRSFTRGTEVYRVDCEVIDPFSPEYDALLERGRTYRKVAEVRVVAIDPGTVVTTHQSSTRRTARTGDVLVQNPTGECYVVSASDLATRYEPKPGTPGVYLAKGIVRAIPLIKHVMIRASWGEWLGAMAGDMLAERADTQERYMIERPAFDMTFVPYDILQEI